VIDHPLPMDAPLHCTIRSGGTLDAKWSDRLGGMGIRASTAEGRAAIELCGRLPDQAALMGVLVTLYNLGLPLISVACHHDRVTLPTPRRSGDHPGRSRRSKVP
jgi:hypothetical protein